MDQATCLNALDWDANPWVILLDGCRADAFTDQHADYLNGELRHVNNGGHTFTADWFAANFPDEYPVSFFHGGQPIHAFDHNTHDYDERDHFERVPAWQAYEWGNDLVDTSLPSGVTSVVKEHAEPDGGGVVRFLQPHNPYRELPGVHGRSDAAEYGTEELWSAYSDNLDWVLGELRSGLVPWLDGDVYVTADHGQALGEDCCGQYLHAPWYEPCVCLTEVPWFEVSR